MFVSHSHRWAVAALMSSAAAVTHVAAQSTGTQFTQAAAHEHGRVTFDIALEGKVLAVALQAPALHVVGFERAPRDAQERARIAAADAWLRSGVAVVGVPAAARCQRTEARVDAAKFGESRKGAHDHAHDHDHDHQPEGKSGDAHDDAHAEYAARYTFTCANPAALEWLELWALKRFTTVETIDVNLTTAAGQSQQRLKAPEMRVGLR
jgi:hypothetical protein